MAKTLVALGTAVAIGAAAFTTSSTPAAAQRWVAPAVAGSFIAGGIVGTAVASSPCGYGYGYGYYGYERPRGLFGDFGTNNCGCGVRGYPAYSMPAQPYVQPDDEEYEQPHYRRHAHSYVQPDDEQYEQPYYRRHMHSHARPYYQRHVLYRLNERRHFRLHHHRVHRQDW